MAKELEDLEHQLEQLKEILRAQLALTSEAQSEEALDSLQRLDSSKASVRASIDESIATMSKLSINTDQIANTVKVLNIMNQEIQSNVMVWFDGSSVDMNNIQNQRKTLQTYGGVAPGEVISYYIDFKK